MKNINSYNVKILQKKELTNINGGNYLKDLGAAAHKAWCAFGTWLSNLEAPQGSHIHQL